MAEKAAVVSTDAAASRSIPEELAALTDELISLQGEIEVVKTKLRNLRKRCKHPNAKRGTYRDITQVSCSYIQCPDCGLDQEN